MENASPDGAIVPHIGAIDPRIGQINPEAKESRTMEKYKITPLKKRWSRGTKILVGCGSGCGLVFFGLFVIILFLLFSLTRPGETFRCEAFIDPEFDNVALLRVNPGDPGAKWALKRYIRVTLERGRPPIPPVMGHVLEDLAVQGRMRNIAWYLPAEITYGKAVLRSLHSSADPRQTLTFLDSGLAACRWRIRIAGYSCTP